MSENTTSDTDAHPTGDPDILYVPAGAEGSQRAIVQQRHNMRVFRDNQQCEILEVFEAEDWVEVDRLCRTALNDPQLPRMHRAQYNIFMCFCDHGMPRYFLNEAMKVVEDMEYLIETEDAEEGIRADVASMRESIQGILDDLVPDYDRMAAREAAAAAAEQEDEKDAEEDEPESNRRKLSETAEQSRSNDNRHGRAVTPGI